MGSWARSTPPLQICPQHPIIVCHGTIRTTPKPQKSPPADYSGTLPNHRRRNTQEQQKGKERRRPTAYSASSASSSSGGGSSSSSSNSIGKLPANGGSGSSGPQRFPAGKGGGGDRAEDRRKKEAAMAMAIQRGTHADVQTFTLDHFVQGVVEWNIFGELHAEANGNRQAKPTEINSCVFTT